MSLFSRLFGKRTDDRDPARALWHRTVAIAREKEWYADCGVADTLPGRFDAITLVLSLVLLRMERDPELAQPSVWLTELFVEDMDGQLREAGVGDMVVGKHIGRLMSVLGGRIGSLREALASDDAALLAGVIARNMTMGPQGDPTKVAARAAELVRQLAQTHGAVLLSGEIAR